MISGAFSIITGIVGLVLWTLIAAFVCVALWAIDADASVMPKTDRLTVRPERAAEEQKPIKPACAKQTVVLLYGADEGGNMVPFAVIRGPMVPC